MLRLQCMAELSLHLRLDNVHNVKQVRAILQQASTANWQTHPLGRILNTLNDMHAMPSPEKWNTATFPSPIS